MSAAPAGDSGRLLQFGSDGPPTGLNWNNTSVRERHEQSGSGERCSSRGQQEAEHRRCRGEGAQDARDRTNGRSKPEPGGDEDGREGSDCCRQTYQRTDSSSGVNRSRVWSRHEIGMGSPTLHAVVTSQK